MKNITNLKVIRYFLLTGIFIMYLLSSSILSVGQTNVVTQHNNLKRTGWNANETVLTQNNVSSGNFGKIFSRQVDDQIYAQPLVVSNLNIGGGKHNVVIVATVNNTIYAFDADSANASTPYWQQNLTYNPATYRPIKNTDMTGACFGNYTDFSGNMGTVCTPVIDTITNTIYILSRSVSKTGAIFVQYLHALDLITGTEKPGSPVYVTATYPGTTTGSVGGIITFNQQIQSPRPGLLLYNGIVYMCWASHCDWGNYNGWVMGYDATTLKQKYVYNSSPTGSMAGIWMSGQAPAVDDNGFIYVTVGNGITGSKSGNPNDTTNRAESLLKLSTASGKLKVADFFTPMDYKFLNDFDLDYGIDGALLIPNTNLSLSGSKESYLYLINNSKMGGTTTDNSNVLQLININATGTSDTKDIHGSPVYFKDNNNNEYIYAWAEEGFLKQIPFKRTTMLFDTLNEKIGNTALPIGMPGAMLSLSSNGSQINTGIIWANHPNNGNANHAVVPGILQAFDATDVTRELWNSNWSSKRDSIGRFAKFVCPTIANGKVYMATFSNSLNVYGLNPPPAPSCANTLPPLWHSADIGYTQYAGDVCYASGKYTITSSGNELLSTADVFHYVYQTATDSSSEILARVDSIQNTNGWAKCGVMFRANLDPGSPYVLMSISPNNIAGFLYRNLQGGWVKFASKTPSHFPYWVKIKSSGNTYTGYTSSDGINWVNRGSITIALGSHPYIGLAYSTNNNTVLGTALVDSVTGLNPPPASSCINTLPPLWHSADIGNTQYAGDVCYASGKYTITSSGNELLSTADVFHYVYQTATDNASQIIARVDSIQNTNGWAKCGVMFRANLDPGSPYVLMSISPNNVAGFLYRNLQGGWVKFAYKIPSHFPYWVKIINSGNTYVGYTSADGINWANRGSITIALGAHPYIGLAYSTNNNTVLGTSLVDNVSIIPGTPLIKVNNFNAYNFNNKNANLKWSTNRELKNGQFEIERSSNTTDFIMIGAVKEEDSDSSLNDYSFEDMDPQDGTNFYRLKHIEINGNFKYSSVVPVIFNLSIIDIFPNPAHNQVYVRNNNNFTNGDKLKIEISEITGKSIYHQTSLTSGVEIITVNLPPKISNGMYILIVTNSKGEKQSRKIFITR